MNWLDFFIIGILIINIGMGWFKGLIRSVVNLISIVAGFVCAKMYHMEMYRELNSRFNLLDKLKSGIADTFSHVEMPELADAKLMTTDQLTGQLPESEVVSSLIENFIKSDQFESVIHSSVDNFSQAFSTWLSDKLLIIVSMFTIFVLVYLGIRIIGYVLNSLFQLPVLKGVNKLSGLLFGLAKGMFFSMLLVIFVVLLGPIMTNLELVETLENSQVAIYFYKYNIVMMIFEGLI